MENQGSLRWAAREDGAGMVGRLGELVARESPSGSRALLESCAGLLAEWGTAVLGREPRLLVRDGVPHLLWAVPDQRVLLLGHYDTVWPEGTLDGWPFSVADGVATGPGVADMKSGIVQMFAALALLGDVSRVGVLLTGDEETGSVTSRPLIEAQARRSGAVLVCEPSNPDGSVKVARKGGSVYRLTAHGRASHAGAAPDAGVNATVELAHQVLAVRGLASATRGTSVTPTLIAGGTTSNTVPESATLTIDVRSWTSGELHRVDRMVRGLAPSLPDARLSLDGGINRHPLSQDVSRPLLETLRECAAALGLTPPEGAPAPGGSDANFTGALGVPTLDGLGGVGGGSHARDEYVDVRAMPDRAALLATLIERVVTGGRAS